MEKQLVNAFDQVTMPEACAGKIEARLGEARADTSRYQAKPMAVSRHGWLAPVAAALALVAAVGLLMPQRAATEQPMTEAPTEAVTTGEVSEGEIAEGTVDVQSWMFEDGAVTAEKGHRPGHGNYSTGSYDTGSTPSWLKEEDGRLYFTGAVSVDPVDITELISAEEPYTYVKTDSDGIIHYMAVGMTTDGPFVSIEESLGWACWYRDAAEMEAGATEGDLHAGWITGYGSGHWNSEKDEEFGWHAKAKELMDIPWG